MCPYDWEQDAQVLTLPPFLQGDPGDENDTDDPPDDSDGWWCLKIPPVRCRCRRLVEYATARHRIVVWPEQDGEILRAAQLVQGKVGAAQIVEYGQALGPCISYAAYIQEREQFGRNICG